MARSCIHKLVNPRQRETIFGTSLVKVIEIDVDSPFAMLPLHQGQVGKSLWKMRLPNEVDSEQLVNFLV